MNFEEDEEWDLDLIDNLVRQEEEAIAARRGGSQAIPFSQPPLPFLVKHQVKEPATMPLKTQNQYGGHHHHHHRRRRLNRHPHPHEEEEEEEEEEQKYIVSELRQRVLQAEKEVDELRKKALRPIVISSSNTDQELERLREQILFKDQEILEAKRAWAEKTEELKKVKSEVQDLRKQFDEHNLPAKREEERVKASISSAQSSQREDAWYPPWKLSGSGAAKFDVSPTIQSRTIHLERVELSTVEELKVRTCDNGCLSSSQKDAKIAGRQMQQEVVPKSSKLRREEKEESGGVKDRPPCRYVDPEKLLKIWYSNSMKGDGIGLISKLFTVCQGDIQVLLSKGTEDSRDTGMPVNNRTLKKSSDMRQSYSSGGREADHGIPGELDLHSILVKMANGFLSPWSLFVALLELCESGNVGLQTQTLESALRILHCILIHDEGCRSKIFGRTPWQDGVSNFPENSFTHRNFGCTDYPVREVKAHCSPRIYCVPAETQLNKNEVSVDNCQEEIERKFSLEKKSHNVLIMTIFKRVLHNANNCCSEPARITALSILALLLMNTEPLKLRESFGFILFDGTISHFLKKSAALEVQSQAVRIVHILLHCPSILRKLCTSGEQESHEIKEKELKKSSNIEVHLIEQESSTGYSEIASGKRKLEDQPEAVDTVPNIENNSIELLEGLVSCLIHAGNTLQAYSLQRNVLRVLTFIATSGKQGALFLFLKNVDFAIDQAKENNTSKKNSSSIVPCSLPIQLMSLLDEQLKAEEEERCSSVKVPEMEERACIMHEALTLICRLASNPAVSATALATLTTNKTVTRFSITVVNRLISRGTLSESLQLQGKHAIVSADTIELSRGLRRRILDNIPHHQG